jgi:hypothetical protein
MQQVPGLAVVSGSIAATERNGGRRGRRGTAALVLAALMLLGTGSAVAQDADAEALFTEGEALETAGKVPEACDAFEASNRIEPRAGTLIRLGQCRETQGRLASAWSAYKDALTRVKDPAKRAVAEQRVASLASRLSYLTVLVSDEARVEGLVIQRNGKTLDAALWNRAAPVDGGVYTIGGHAPGHEEWTTTVEVGNEADKASVEVPRFKELSKLVDNTTGPDGPDTTGPEDPGGETPSAFTGKRKIAVAAAGIGLAAIAGGVVFGMQAKGLEDDAFVLCPDPAVPCADAPEAQDKLDSGRSKAMLANIAYGVGGAAVIGAAVLWFTGAPKAEPARVGVHPTLRPGYSGVDVTVRF